MREGSIVWPSGQKTGNFLDLEADSRGIRRELTRSSDRGQGRRMSLGRARWENEPGQRVSDLFERDIRLLKVDGWLRTGDDRETAGATENARPPGPMRMEF